MYIACACEAGIWTILIMNVDRDSTARWHRVIDTRAQKSQSILGGECNEIDT